MASLSFNQPKIENLIRQVFPKAEIVSHKKFKTGLVSQTFKVRIKNPDKVLVVKLSKLKRKESILVNNKILEYLHENSLPAPRIYLTLIKDRKIITIMDYLAGEPASDIFKKISLQKKKKFLENAGRLLNQIHYLRIPPFWKHHKHEIRTEKEWKLWTKERVRKYEGFLNDKLDEAQKIDKELRNFITLLEKTKFKMVPLHWDYHFFNMNVDSSGKIVGVFDFDNAMGGHNLADIGQTAYWLRFHLKSNEYIKYFLKGYGEFSKNNLELIKGYELLHILAVTRSIWFKQKRLGWIIEEHKKMLKELLK